MYARLVPLSLVVALATGCSLRETTPTRPAPSSVLRVTPADGATDVRLDAALTLDFGRPVDRGLVQSGFHLVSEADMNGSCPDTSMAAHGPMDAVMADSSMMAHMDTFHATHGTFSWNDAGTACTFQPDTLMRSQTRYMMHMSRAMLEMMEGMGSSMGPGQMMGTGDMVAHFRTMTDDGHAGHHP